MELLPEKHGLIIQTAGRVRKPLAGTGRYLLFALAIGFGSLVFKGALLALDAFPFNADEAIVGLMARHTLEGDWPILFYGQAYMGSLDATLIVPFFALLGSQVIWIRVVQALLYLGILLTTMRFVRIGFGSEKMALLAGLLMAIPTVNVTLYTTVSLGGYGEAMLLGNMILLLSVRIWRGAESAWPYLAWGLVAGLGLWTSGMTLVYIVPSGCVLAWSLISGTRGRGALKAAVVAVGSLIGVSPLLYFGLMEGGGEVVSELLGSAIAGASPAGFLGALAERLGNLLIFGTTVTLGLRAPWEIRLLALPLAPFAVAFWIMVIVHAASKLKQPRKIGMAYALVCGVAATLVLGFLATPFGADPSGRYFIPLAPPMAILGADLLTGLRRKLDRRLTVPAIILVLAFNSWGTVQSARRNPPGLTTQFNATTQVDHRYMEELIAFLDETGEQRGYTNYWVSYPLAFQSDEQIVYVPRLPYHLDFRYTTRDDRYAPYDELVDESLRAAYITTNHPDLDQHLRQSFQELGVTWGERGIGDYHVFYNLSRKVTPQEIGLGQDAR